MRETEAALIELVTCVVNLYIKRDALKMYSAVLNVFNLNFLNC